MKKLLCYFLSLFSFILVAQESYYNDVDLNLTGLTLKNNLATKITTTHTKNLLYTPDIWNASMITDVNPNNSMQVLLMYGYESGTDRDITNDRERAINNNGGDSGQWNREHVYANSLGTPNLDRDGTSLPPYADAHNLRPCDIQRNSSRGNKLFIAESGNSRAVSMGWYPGDEWKGDVARIVMYMYLRYGDRCLPTNVGIGNSGATPDKMIDLFLQWNADDPVSNFEKQRNAYHENTSNTYAQGNRNPFIDNSRLATRIWGGPKAEDIWGIYTNSDVESPSVPMNLVASNITTFSIDLSWDASVDNVAVTSYNVYVNGNFEISTSSTNHTINGLTSNTSYNLTVLAKDIADNSSPQSLALMASTLEDTQAPTVPTNIVISNQTDTSFKITWNPSTDNTAVTTYDVYLDQVFNGTTSNTTYTANSLTASTTYLVTVLAKDAAENTSSQSTSVEAITTDGGTANANELFISEYIEGNSNNKAIEIANVTRNPINLSPYNLRRQGNGAGSWSKKFQLTGNLNSGDVFVIINGGADIQTILDQADTLIQNIEETNYGEPLNFNGNDPVGLFKNDDLIDIIGVFDGGSSNFAKNVTLRRKPSVVQPNTTYDLLNEWIKFPQNTVDGLGHRITLSTFNFNSSNPSLYPNPTSFNYIFVKYDKDIKVEVFNILGEKLIQSNITTFNPKLDISMLSNGIYLLRASNNQNITIKKFIKQ